MTTSELARRSCELLEEFELIISPSLEPPSRSGRWLKETAHHSTVSIGFSLPSEYVYVGTVGVTSMQGETSDRGRARSILVHLKHYPKSVKFLERLESLEEDFC